VKNTVTGLTPVNVSLLVDLSKVMPFELCTNRKSAFFGASGVGCAYPRVKPLKKPQTD
jgi:hypothetical protein